MTVLHGVGMTADTVYSGNTAVNANARYKYYCNLLPVQSNTAAIGEKRLMTGCPAIYFYHIKKV